ncbi:MAG: hypothetical protein LBE02_04265 [Spirochaetaceae bacterium]|nr:hypothetical protein [Spirochaetaceae bacterium]
MAIFSKKHLFIINPRSFLGFREINRVIAEIVRCFDGPLAARQFFGDVVPVLPNPYSISSPYAIHISRFPRDPIIVIRKYMALMKTPVRIYAIGGDGLVFSCLNGIAELPNAELAIVPYGTGSDFTQSFGGVELIPRMRNIQKQIDAPVIPTDLIDCGGIYALNACALGFEGMATLKSYAAFKTLWRIRRRFPAVTEGIYRIAGVLELFDADTMGQYYQVQMDDEKLEGPMSLIHIANNPGYPINKRVIPEAVPDDGVLDMVIYRKSSLLKSLRRMPYYLKGQHGKFPENYLYRRVRSVSISSDRPLCISLDGEVFFDTAFNIRVAPRAVRIAAVDGMPFKHWGSYDAK